MGNGELPTPDFNDPGLMAPREVGLVTDLYELTMAASYHRQGINDEAVFELFVRRLPPNRDWLLVAGIGPTLRLVADLAFHDAQLAYLESIGFDPEFREYLAGFRFSGEIDAMPEGTVCFANEPLVRVTAPRIEAQILETLLLNQVNFQTMVASKAARVVLAAGGGEPGAGESVIDFSPRRDHGIEAAMKVARSAAVAGCGGTSNVAAAMRYGLTAIGTMAHSYVMSFRSERDAFRAFLRDHPERAVLLVDTYDPLEGVANAIAAASDVGIELAGIRHDSGDIGALARESRRMLDEAGMQGTRIAASGDLEEGRIATLVAAGAPIDIWGVGTELGTSRDSPVVNGVYKLVADRAEDGSWRPVAKRSADKETVGGAKQVYRTYADGLMAGDLVAGLGEEAEGEQLLVPALRDGQVVLGETLERIRSRTHAQLTALPPANRLAGGSAEPYPVRISARLAET
jgi:nicotinate phosphoribosyltransferase